MVNKEIISNLTVILLTFIGFAIGFINEEYRILAWTISFVVILIIISFIIFTEYINKVENNEREIQQLKQDLNIQNRLSIMETKFDEFSKRGRK